MLPEQYVSEIDIGSGIGEEELKCRKRGYGKPFIANIKTCSVQDLAILRDILGTPSLCNLCMALIDAGKP